MVNIAKWTTIISLLCFGAWVIWFVIRPNMRKTEVLLKTKARDLNIAQIKRSIKSLQITKEELFDE